MQQPTPYSTWKHKASNSTYTVLGVAVCSTNGEEGNLVVVYISHTHQELKYRDLDEFMDGRFVRMP